MLFRVFVFIFCLEAMLRNDIWMRASSPSVMILFSKMSIWKLLYHSYVQNFFSIITWNMLTKILNDTRQFPGWITIHANMLIISSRLEKTSWKTNQRSYLENYHFQKKNTILHFNKHCIEIKDMSTIAIRFFCQTFKQT